MVSTTQVENAIFQNTGIQLYLIMSYCPKIGKVVTLMSTMHLSKGEKLGSEKNPKVIIYYNSTKVESIPWTSWFVPTAPRE